MTNKEKYKQAFSVMHISDEFYLEVKNMKTTRKKLKLNRLLAGIAVCVLMMGSATVAYATDFCGIQRTLQLWIYGEQTNAIVHFDENGKYSLDAVNDASDSQHQGGGGTAFDENGNERPLTEEELFEQLHRPEVNYKDDGSVWVYYFDRKIDITNQFKNNVCYIRLMNGKEVLYMTVKYQNGFSTSPGIPENLV